ncbi:MAG: hypothetical protein JW785_05515 [Acidimicrobiia bacterium]|nr:hypothetical protein [Acidimicrobiia bacterium]
MSAEARRRRGLLREAAGEAWGLALEVVIVGFLVAAALALAGLILLVA